jgi:hypothetical protein
LRLTLHIGLDRLKVLEKRVLRRIFGSKTEEVIGGRQNLRTKNLHNCYCTSNIIWVIKSKKVRRRQLGRPRRMWKNNIEIDV